MSVEAFSWALNVPVGGNMKVMLLGLANHAHPDGTEAYPALDTLATYGYCDRSTARRNVRKLVEDGWIVVAGEGPAKQVKYTLRLDVPLPKDGLSLEGLVLPPWRTCVYCGGAADVLDHVKPKAHGGSDGPVNRVPACKACNASKAAWTLDEWAARTGRDPAELHAAVGGWQNATQGGRGVASEPWGGGTGATGGVAAAPPEPSIEPSTEQEKNAGGRARESGKPAHDPRDVVPDDFPEALRPHARIVMKILRTIAADHGATKVWPKALALLMMRNPNLPFVATAHELNVWAVDPPRPIKDVLRTYRTFLARATPLEVPEKLAEDGTPAVREVPSGGRGHLRSVKTPDQAARDARAAEMKRKMGWGS